MNSKSVEIYRTLEEKLEEKSRLSGVLSVLHWDQEVIMPPGAVESRASQIAAMAGVLHDKSTDAEWGELLEQLSDGDSFNDFQACNIREAKRDYDMETKVPKELVQEIAALASRGHHVWAKARQENRFDDFAPVIKRFIELKKEWAGHVYPEKMAYDANVDVYERGATMKQLTPIFERVKSELIPFIQSIGKCSNPPDTSFLNGIFPIKKQEELGRRVSGDMGFSFDHGRMDVSVHPFCGGGHPTDVRITTRYREDNFIESLYAVIHETGHGLYEQGRMTEAWDLETENQRA